MESNIKVVEKIGGNPGMDVVVMAGVHGDEDCGVKAFDNLISKINVDRGRVTFIYANLEAQRQNKRYIEYNLNRCFSDEQPSEMAETLEGRTAKEILPFLRRADTLLDLHSSKNSDSLKCIICERDCFDFISSFNLEKVVVGIDDFQKGGSDGYMYRQKKLGVCIECGLRESNDSVKIAEEAILRFLVKTGNTPGVNGKNILKRIFKIVRFYKNKNGPFRLEKKFKNFEKFICRTLVGYDGDEKIYLEKDDVIIFPYEPKEIGRECFIVLREETLLNLKRDVSK